MKVITRVLIAMVASIAALFVSTGTSNAGLDNELSVVDGQGRTATPHTAQELHVSGIKNSTGRSYDSLIVDYGRNITGRPLTCNA